MSKCKELWGPRLQPSQFQLGPLPRPLNCHSCVIRGVASRAVQSAAPMLRWAWRRSPGPGTSVLSAQRPGTHLGRRRLGRAVQTLRGCGDRSESPPLWEVCKMVSAKWASGLGGEPRGDPGSPRIRVAACRIQALGEGSGRPGSPPPPHQRGWAACMDPGVLGRPREATGAQELWGGTWGVHDDDPRVLKRG